MSCPVCACSAAVAASDQAARDAIRVECDHCGTFGLTRPLLAVLPGLLAQKDAAPKLSHVVRKAHESGQKLVLDSYTAQAVLANPLPRPREQADLLVQWLAVNSPGPGESVVVGFDTHGAIVGARSHAGFALLVGHLLTTGLVTGAQETYLSGEFIANIALTFAGWDAYESLRLGGASYRKAFMAMKFGDAVLDGFLGTVLKPAAKRAGFDLFKLDDRPRAGLIDDRMRVEIRASDFIIADLTTEP
jgi:hypothetical protein